ncbi:MAG: cytochrome d ubiquinol oxidase subunit II [Jatrophihabitans sp.]|uniref:cytochrome d ubiquinol oxidase subunit II n=1 Tax=Jatrophihabitans sp. TaxID=1932789 RepID=UPI003F803CFF
MDMQAFWFGVIAVLWAGFLALEGFDFGVGMLLRFVGRTDAERQVALRAIGPVWDGNEVWLLVAGGATFAAFPEWYASVFSGFYLAFALLLVGLILRGIGVEYRSKVTTARARAWCDGATIVGSLLPSLLLGVAFADFLRGVQMDANHVVTGGFWSLLHPYALLGGLVTLTLFAYHGATYLAFRTIGPTAARAAALSRPLAIVVAPLAVAFLVWSATIRGGWVSLVLAAVVAALFVTSALCTFVRRAARAFWASAAVCALLPVWLFSALWPDVLPARNHAAWSLTVHNASSTHTTLVVMTVVALLFTPIVLAYQAWTYWVFRARVGLETVVIDADTSAGSALERMKRAAQAAS